MTKHDEKWKNEPEAKTKRVFRTTKVPFEQDKRILATVNRAEGVDKGTTVRPLLLKKSFNHAGQYILQENEQEYIVQLMALRRAEKNGKILEVDPVWEGKPFIPAPPPDERDKLIAAKNKEIEELNAKLAESKGGKPAKDSGSDGDKGASGAQSSAGSSEGVK